MNLNLTNILQNPSQTNQIQAGPSAGRQTGVILEDSETVTWATDGFGNITATSSGGSAPTGTANQVYATPNGASGSAALRSLLTADLPTTTAVTNADNSFTTNQTIPSVTIGGSSYVLGQGGFGEFAVFGVFGREMVAVGSGFNSNVGLYLSTWATTIGWNGSSQYNGDGTLQGLSYIGSNAFGFGAQGSGGSVQDGALAAAFFMTGVGTQLTAAATITLTRAVHHVTGGTAIENIDLPANAVAVSGARCTLIPDDASGQSWGATGNIANAGTFTQHQAQDFVFDGTSWYPVV